jgi:hypothetical protein
MFNHIRPLIFLMDIHVNHAARSDFHKKKAALERKPPPLELKTNLSNYKN